MKKVLMVMGFIFSCIALYAQDVIVKVNGDEIQSKVVEVSTTEVKYKKFNNLEGPTYTIEKKEIFMIKYANGEKEVFEKPKAEPKATVPQRTAKPATTQTPATTQPAAGQTQKPAATGSVTGAASAGGVSGTKAGQQQTAGTATPPAGGISGLEQQSKRSSRKDVEDGFRYIRDGVDINFGVLLNVDGAFFGVAYSHRWNKYIANELIGINIVPKVHGFCARFTTGLTGYIPFNDTGSMDFYVTGRVGVAYRQLNVGYPYTLETSATGFTADFEAGVHLSRRFRIGFVYANVPEFSSTYDYHTDSYYYSDEASNSSFIGGRITFTFGARKQAK
jgi:hypothetical protein